MAAMSSADSLTSSKLERMREGVTDLGMTEWPPFWDQARMTWAGVAPSLEAISLMVAFSMRRGRPKELLPKA